MIVTIPAERVLESNLIGVETLDPGSFALVGFAFGLGAATFFAPCAYPLLPGYVAYFLGSEGEKQRSRPEALVRAVFIGVVVSAGFFLVYGSLAAVAATFGPSLLSNIAILELVVGVLLIGLGVAMVAGWTIPTPHVALPERQRSGFGFFLFGVVYAAAAAGCTAPLFIAVAVRAFSVGPVGATATLLAYAAGMSVLMIVVTALTALGRDTLVRTMSRRAGTITRASGALLVVAGLVQLYFFIFEFDGLATVGIA